MDSTGRFDEASYFQALRDPRNDTTVSNVTKTLREDLKKQKLSNILQSAIRTTRADMWERYENMNAKATIEFIKLNPSKNSREFISKVTEDEIKKYYEDHHYLYKQDEARKIKFVVFRESPTPKDSVKLMESIEGLKKKWMALPLNASDSAVNDLAHSYSDAGYQPPIMMTPNMFSQYNNSEEIVNTKLGDIAIGVTQGKINVMRILEVQDTGVVFYHAKNILIGFGKPENKDSAKALATKLFNDIKGGKDFAEVARQFSQDPSARNGGDMRWMGPRMYIPAFEEVAMKAPIGELQGPLETVGGYHIFQVVARTNKKLKVGTIPVDIKPSSQTTRMIAQQASIFREKAAKDGFDQVAQAQNLRVTADGPPVMKKGVSPLFGYMPFVNYMFELSSGDISQPVRIPNAHFTVVAQVTDVMQQGIKPLDSTLKEQIKATVAKRKSIEALATKAKELRSMLSPGDNFSKITAVDSTIRPSTTTFGPAESAPGLGTEYAVNNVAFTMKPGEISQPIQGENGFYIIKLLDIKPADKKQYEAQKTQEFEKLNQEKQQRFFQQWLEELKDKATVVDYRSHRN